MIELICIWIIGAIIATVVKRNEPSSVMSKKTYILCLVIPLYFYIWAMYYNIKEALKY